MNRTYYENVVQPLVGLVLSIVFIVVILIGMLSFFKSVDESYISYSDLYAKYGVLGEHDMAVLDPSGNELSGQVSGGGSFFLVFGGGTFQGQVQTGDVVQFRWVVPSGLSTVVEVPYRNILWDYQAKYVNPTFEFNFTQEQMNGSVYKDTEIGNFNDLFNVAPTITIHITWERFVEEIQSKISQ
ncbi:MAG: hypothetical protein UW68_C0016G0013 [Candidatus Collierbacteria bacterium GW2011_GWB1_44_6]|uniref:Uncharacterized protein n=2 Tax=Candidatus Collieribacteriota TaxID=1752725 RepID=A0A0G1JP92_9BACT|nr:MAG: hypothetical protein UV68_C0017G0020 [Candidatus Collierbacteria bacterium GW2011_GWC2_43_12]KKT73133.1 MAG: hypothetical protein UW68_C0016G0013 [Candidatus Collierbacteria bacterium GW2011_GWB1_44_6]KKT82970.1 MAG: hypothetical protein UW80_C0025G0003 [Microgenomates group bacterium GW2011_GWC1_44_9]